MSVDINPDFLMGFIMLVLFLKPVLFIHPLKPQHKFIPF